VYVCVCENYVKFPQSLLVRVWAWVWVFLFLLQTRKTMSHSLHNQKQIK